MPGRGEVGPGPTADLDTLSRWTLRIGLVNDGLPVSDQEPLISALREENERLRAQNRMLNEQMAAAQAAQTELAKHLRVTAPLRRVQESLRHRAGEKRREASGGRGGRRHIGNSYASHVPRHHR